MSWGVEHHIQMAQVLDSMLTGVTFCCWTFWFSHRKASDANFVCEKLDCESFSLVFVVTLANCCNWQDDKIVPEERLA